MQEWECEEATQVPSGADITVTVTVVEEGESSSVHRSGQTEPRVALAGVAATGQTAHNGRHTPTLMVRVSGLPKLLATRARESEEDFLRRLGCFYHCRQLLDRETSATAAPRWMAN